MITCPNTLCDNGIVQNQYWYGEDPNNGDPEFPCRLCKGEGVVDENDTEVKKEIEFVKENEELKQKELAQRAKHKAEHGESKLEKMMRLAKEKK